MLRIIQRAALAAVVLALGACAVVPGDPYYSGDYYGGYYGGGYYGGGYYASPAPVFVTPAPVLVRPSLHFGVRSHRHHGHGHGHGNRH